MRNAILLPQSGDDGKLLENAVFLHLKRNRKPNEKICYYQGNKECDFAIQHEDTIVRLIQVTWEMSDETTRRREIDGLTEAAEQTKCNDLTIVTADEEDELTADGRKIKIVPAWKWLLS